MTLAVDSTFTSQLMNIARKAGDAILEVYNSPRATDVQTKGDNSPLTAADLAAHQVIAQALPSLLAIPLISEESDLPPLEQRQAWAHYWLIDPLDGTKEFIARNGQFTVNIALVVNNVPVLGVVHVPVTGETYLGVDKSIAADQQSRAEKYLNAAFDRALMTQSMTRKQAEQQPLGVLMSLRHGSAEQNALVERLAQRWPAPLQPVTAGSSLKFCWIAEGKADFYPRLAPTSEWDTAAAQAVLTAAGGMVVCAEDFEPLRCNTRDTLLNPFFLAMGDADFPWRSLLS